MVRNAFLMGILFVVSLFIVGCGGAADTSSGASNSSFIVPGQISIVTAN